jgi:hypothetical protein
VTIKGAAFGPGSVHDDQDNMRQFISPKRVSCHKQLVR